MSSREFSKGFFIVALMVYGNLISSGEHFFIFRTFCCNAFCNVENLLFSPYLNGMESVFWSLVQLTEGSPTLNYLQRMKQVDCETLFVNSPLLSIRRLFQHL